MAEAKPSRIRAWIKAGITSLMGLCSGAILMYVSPLVTTVIKPSKPLANFGQTAQGLVVTFQNRATGASEGWWDFGDGSPLEPFSANQETLRHVYGHTGTYNVKLSLQNFLGDAQDRTITINLDGDNPSTPVIDSFKVEPLKPDTAAPATFRVSSQVRNAELCIWSLGEDRPLELSTDSSPSQERYVTFKEPGYYTLRLFAVSGKNTTQKSQVVLVNVGDSGTASASLQVAFEAQEVKRLLKEINLHAAFPAERTEQSYWFSLSHDEPGYQIVDAKFARPITDAAVRTPVLTISPDKTKVVLTGELVKPGGIMAWQKNAPRLRWTPTIALTLERRGASTQKSSDPIAADLSLPGTTLIPLPKMGSHWDIKTTTFNLELRDGDKVVFKDNKLPISSLVQFKSHPYRVSAVRDANQVRLEVIDAKATLRPIGN